jgi:ComF family protein
VLVAARSATALEGPAEALVRALKYGGWRRLAPDLAHRMAQVPLAPSPHGPAKAVVPVPTSPARVRRRGYNQALLLARCVAEAKGLPVVEAVRRIRGTRSQVSLQVEERATNVEASFEVAVGGAWSDAPRHVILVDDVLTTGATASAVAGVLGTLGVRAVTALTFARALPNAVDAVPD